MKYAVYWKPAAARDLATIWLETEDRSAVTSAADSIDTLLRTQAERCGESREGQTRVLFLDPLGIDFDFSRTICG